jgi:octaprenyl-diphosphate synthase
MVNAMRSQYTELFASIEDSIDAMLPAEASPEWVRAVGLGDSGDEARRRIVEALLKPTRDLIGRGGKRWRPLLLVLASDAASEGADQPARDAARRRALSLSALPELIHNGSLIVDDIEDRSDTRRGRPAVHVSYGEDVAINAGNFLYFLPFAFLEAALPDPTLRSRVAFAALEDLRRLHVGQAMDIAWHNSGDFFPDERDYLYMCSMKTGSLARLAARVGSISGGAEAEMADALGDAFAKVGVAFQILDDVKNLEAGNPGKARGDDVVEGKRGLPFIRAVARDPELGPPLAALFVKARAEGASSQAVEAAIALAERAGGIASARDAALAMLDRARSEVATLLPRSYYLRDFFEILV